MSGYKNEFGAWDYVVFVAMLLISLGIGVFFAVRGDKQKTQGEYLMGNREMFVLPVAISILVSYMSAILILGTPAEMYTQGTADFLSTFGVCLGIGLAVIFFVPLLYPLKITSAFEYLEKRFNSRATRLTGMILLLISEVIYIGIAAFAPATALHAVTGFPVWAAVLITGVVATAYTSIGGMKAVIWTDVFQSSVMMAGILAIVIQGTIKVGGMSRVWEINYEWKRINFFNFDLNPTTRHSVWGLLIGTAMIWVGTYGINQSSVQRYNSLPTLNKAIVSVLLNMIGVIVLVSITCLCGIVVFAYYANKGCDPLSLKLVANSNQLIPYFVMEVLSYPGVPGLFISSLFSGALSSLSSSLNALSAITWEDILKPYLDTRLSESKKTLLLKIMVILYGAVSIGVSFVIENLEGTVIQISSSLVGSVLGPLTGMFALGGFFPWANSYGAIIGSIFGFTISMWMSIGSYANGIPLLELPYPNGTCFGDENFNMTTLSTTVASMATPAINMTTTDTKETGSSESYGLIQFYNISYLWFNSIGTAATIIVGLLVSLVTGPNNKDDVPTRYQIPFFTRLFCCLPNSVLYKLNCCRHFEKLKDIIAEDKYTENDIKIPPEESWIKDSTTFVNGGFDDILIKIDPQNAAPYIESMSSFGKETKDENSDNYYIIVRL